MSASSAIRLIKKYGDLFHCPANQAYITVTTETGKKCTWPVRSREFWSWASRLVYVEESIALSTRNRDDILAPLEGHALYKMPEREVFHRVAKSGENYVIDLCDEAGNVVLLNKDGWQVTTDSPVRFCSSAARVALPIPLRNQGCSSELWDFVNVPERDRCLVLVWIIDCWRSDTKKPLLELIGEQGSGKSSTQQILKRLVDPQVNNLYSAVASEAELYMHADQFWLLSFNNLSFLNKKMQDAFCNIATGGTSTRRKLYTDSEIAEFGGIRPVIMNGISVLATEPDVADRTIKIELQRLKKRRDEEEMYAGFSDRHPSIFGSLLDVFVHGLQHIEAAGESGFRCRMTQYEQLGNAIYSQKQGADFFSDRYYEKQSGDNADALDGSPTAQRIIEILSDKENEFAGTLQELYEILDGERGHLRRANIRNARALGDRLRRDSRVLESAGITKIDLPRSSTGRRVALVYQQDEQVA